MRSISIGMLCFFSSISTVSSYPVTYTIVYWYDVNVWHDLIFRFGLWCMHGSVCLCVFASDIYVDTSQEKKEFVQFSFFYLVWKSLEKKSKNSTHYYEVPTRVYTKSLHYHWCCSSLYYVTFSYLIFFIRFSPLDKIDLNVMLSYMLLFTCSFFLLFKSIYIPTILYFFLPINFVSDRIYSLPFSIFFFPFKVSRLLPQTACL